MIRYTHTHTIYYIFSFLFAAFLGFVIVSETSLITIPHQTHEQETITQLLCTNSPCTALLGTIDPSTQEGYKLQKTSLSLSTSTSTLPISYERSKWLSLNILTAIESQGVRKFTIPAPATQDQTQRQLRLWIFTPDLLVSTSALESNEPVRVAKILWRLEDVADGEGDGLAEKLSRQALSEGELNLRDDEIKGLVELLRQSAKWLPEGARRFGEWDVGLLERFTKADLNGR